MRALQVGGTPPRLAGGRGGDALTGINAQRDTHFSCSDDVGCVLVRSRRDESSRGRLPAVSADCWITDAGYRRRFIRS